MQYKLYDFVRNQKFEGIVAGVVMRICEISDNNVFMYPNEKDVALVISVNNYHII